MPAGLCSSTGFERCDKCVYQGAPPSLSLPRPFMVNKYSFYKVTFFVATLKVYVGNECRTRRNVSKDAYFSLCLNLYSFNSELDAELNLESFQITM